MAKENLRLLALLVDVEGCISTSSKPTRNIRVSVGMTDPDWVLWAYEQFGGRLYTYRKKKKKNHQKYHYSWRILSDEAACLLEVIGPFLKIKRSQALLGIKMQSLPLNQREKYAKAISKLNKRTVTSRARNWEGRREGRPAPFPVMPPPKSWKLTQDDVLKIIGLLSQELTYKEIAKRFGVSTSSVGKIARGERLGLGGHR